MRGPLLLASSFANTGGWKWTGNFTTLDLIAAGTNALNGALLARRPDHYKNFTVVGIMLMALLMGLGGGATREVLVNQIPNSLTNPAYITVAVTCGAIGVLPGLRQGSAVPEGLFQFMTSFSLPLYAIIGAQKGESAGLPVLGALALAVIGPTAGRWYVDVSSGVSPKHFVRGEWFVGTALLTGIVWITCDAAGLNTWWSAGISFAVGYTRARDGAVPRLGGASGQRTRRCLQARRWPSPAGAQDPGQVPARTERSRPARREPQSGRILTEPWAALVPLEYLH